jgi:hypothetical protein
MRLAEPGVQRLFPAQPFVPAPVDEQLEQIDRGLLKLGSDEVLAGTERVRLAAECVRGASAGAGGVVLGIAAAGMKTRDGRGICAARNGPRIPDYLETLAEELADVRFAAFPGRLWSDGDCSGFGERAGGALADVQHGYYLGGGTGLAESLLLDGEVVLLDDGLDWFPKAWQLECPAGETFEALLGFDAINATWRKAAGPLAPPHPERAAAEGSSQARLLMQGWAESLAELLLHRVRAVDARKRVLERIVLGQRLGAWFGSKATAAESAAPGVGTEFVDEELFRRPLEAALAARLASEPQLAFQYLLDDGTLREGFVRGSSLRAAPALGAAVRAANPASA